MISGKELLTVLNELMAFNLLSVLLASEGKEKGPDLRAGYRRLKSESLNTELHFTELHSLSVSPYTSLLKFSDMVTILFLFLLFI